MRRILSAAAALALVGAMLPMFAAPVLADSYGGCGDIVSANYTAGENFPGASNRIYLSGVQAEVDVNNTYFHLCSGGTFLGMDMSGGVVGIKNSIGAFAYIGLAKCAHAEGEVPGSLCDGSLHLFTEVFAGYVTPHVIWDEGSISAAPQSLKVNLQGDVAKFYLKSGGIYYLIREYDFAGRLYVGDSSNVARVYGETHDSGDGLGNNVSGQSLNFGNVQWRQNSEWLSVDNGGSCDWNSGNQMTCKANGSNGIYLYTVN